MKRQSDVLVIIPARNEEGRIGSVIRGIRHELPEAEVLVIEDGSEDDTVGVVRSLGVRLVSLPINLGYGGALRVGFNYALSKGYDIAISMDADGQHDPRDLRAVLSRLRDDGLDLVIGSRFLGELSYRIPWSRRVGIFLFSTITSAVVGKRISDTTCGMMGVGSEALPVVARNCATDFPNAELICIVSRCGREVGEVPITVHPRTDGRSMFTFWKSFYYPFKMMLAVGMTVIRD